MFPRGRGPESSHDHSEANLEESQLSSNPIGCSPSAGFSVSTGGSVNLHGMGRETNKTLSSSGRWFFMVSRDLGVPEHKVVKTRKYVLGSR